MIAKSLCPKCHASIPLDDINVAADTALCRQCGSAWHFSDLLEVPETRVDLMRPPRGAWYNQTGAGFEVGVSTRSFAAFFIIPFMCVWSGVSLGGIYGTQIIHGKFNLFQSLFGIPFLLGTLLIGSFALMTVCGKVVVSRDGDEGTIFSGIGPIGWKRRFNWSGVTAIRRTVSFGRNNSPSNQLTLEGQNRLNFAGGMNAARQEFLLATLQQKLLESTN